MRTWSGDGRGPARWDDAERLDGGVVGSVLRGRWATMLRPEGVSCHRARYCVQNTASGARSIPGLLNFILRSRPVQP